MAEKRKGRKRKEDDLEDSTPAKEEYKVAQYLRAKLTTKKTVLLSHRVEYFTASKAIDLLLDSDFAKGKKNVSPLFTTRESVVHFLDVMLHHKFFHRAKKIPVTVKEKKKLKDKDDESSHAEDVKEKTKGLTERSHIEEVSEKKKKKKKKLKEPDEDKDSDGEKKKDDSDKKEEKKKRKIKLDMHLEQIFVDGNEAYVWIYDPIPTKSWVIGGLLVIGAILICVFPLWPPSIRKGVYYLSIVAAGFLCVIIGLAILRLIVFCVIWGITMGRHHLWLLPNLTEDVGFFDSFWPLYKYEYKDGEEKKKAKKKKKDKISAGIEEIDKILEGAAGDTQTLDEEGNDSDRDDNSESERDSEHSSKHTENGSNGFEMVDKDESDGT